MRHARRSGLLSLVALPVLGALVAGALPGRGGPGDATRPEASADAASADVALDTIDVWYATVGGRRVAGGPVYERGPVPLPLDRFRAHDTLHVFYSTDAPNPEATQRLTVRSREFEGKARVVFTAEQPQRSGPFRLPVARMPPEGEPYTAWYASDERPPRPLFITLHGPR